MRYRFGPFEADTASRELWKEGVPLKLGEQPFKVLASLLERAGDEVPRAELHRRIWPEGSYVDLDKGLNSAVNKLREALADSAERPRYIETVPKRGYRFVARLESEHPQPDGPGVAGTPAGEPALLQEKGKRRWILAPAAIAALGLIAVLQLSFRGDPATAAVRSLLILPFQSATSPDSDYLGQGISEQVIARLAAIPGIRLISPAAAQRIGSEGITPQEAGQRLKAEAVLFGSVRRTEHRIRVNAQLIRSGSGQVLWAEGGLEVEGNDLLEAERLLSARIAALLSRSLNYSQQGSIARRPTSSGEAYELFVRGKVALGKRNPEDDAVAEKLLLQATRLAPAFAEAFAWLAMAQYSRFRSGDAGGELRQASLENARKALAIDPGVTAARRALIAIYHSTGQAEEGLQQAAILRQAGTTDVDSLAAVAQAYLRGGMPDRSVAVYKQAIDLDPEDDLLRSGLSFAASWARQYELGLEVAKSNPSKFSFPLMLNAVGARNVELAQSAALETMRREDPFIFAMCWQDLKGIGNMDSARRIWRARLPEFEKDAIRLRNERVRIGLGILYADLGEREKALDHLRLAAEANPGDPWSLYYASEVYGLLNEREKALESLQQSVDRGFLSLYYLDHQFDCPPRGLYRFRNDARFREVRDRLAARIERLRNQY